MKKLAIVVSLAVILFVVIIVLENTDMSINNPNTNTTEPTSTPTGATCVEHDFSKATFISPRKCKICDVTDGEPLCMQCETWEDVVALAGFEEYDYDLQVMDSTGSVILYITINDANLFATEDTANNFMLSSYSAFQCISWFSQNRLDVTTPKMFQVDTSIRLNFADGSLTCMPIDNRYRTGYSTMLSCEKDSSNKYTLEQAYYRFFKLVAIENATG